MRRLFILLLPMLLLAGAQLPAERAHADQIALDFQHAQVVKLAKPARSVIIGDPFVADITMEDPTTLVLFGKQPGLTNLVVTDQNGDILLNWPVMVRDATENRVSVIGPGDKRSIYEGIWMCTDQNRCLRIPGASDIDPFKYNATQASTNPNATGPSGSGGGNSNNQTGNTGGTGSDNTGGGSGGGETQPPSN